MTILWDSAALRHALTAPVRGEIAATGVSIDSRSLEKGDLFIALSGANFDGGDYVEDALAKGAAAVITTRRLQDARVITVPDTAQALQQLAMHARSRFHGTVFAITGSVGKTTTKEMLAACLASLGTVHATVGNLNNHYGVPLTPARLPEHSVFAVIEMGMNHGGEITPLTKLARPHHTAITAISPAHIENFSDITGIADAKAEIFLSRPHSAVIPFDSDQCARLTRAATNAGVQKILGAGTHAGADVRLQSLEEEANDTLTAIIVTPNATLDCTFSTHHLPLVYNALTVVGMLQQAGLPLEPCLTALAAFTPAKGRGQRLHLQGNITIIDDSYNASPTSMKEAIATLGRASGRKIAVLGDMLELGENSTAYHTALAEDLMRHGIDTVFCVGTAMRHLYEALPPEKRGSAMPLATTIAPIVADFLTERDTVLIKGSRGSRMDAVVTYLTR